MGFEDRSGMAEGFFNGGSSSQEKQQNFLSGATVLSYCSSVRACDKRHCYLGWGGGCLCVVAGNSFCLRRCSHLSSVAELVALLLCSDRSKITGF